MNTSCPLLVCWLLNIDIIVCAEENFGDFFWLLLKFHDIPPNHWTELVGQFRTLPNAKYFRFCGASLNHTDKSLMQFSLKTKEMEVRELEVGKTWKKKCTAITQQGLFFFLSLSHIKSQKRVWKHCYSLFLMHCTLHKICPK